MYDVMKEDAAQSQASPGSHTYSMSEAFNWLLQVGVSVGRLVAGGAVAGSCGAGGAEAAQACMPCLPCRAMPGMRGSCPGAPGRASCQRGPRWAVAHMLRYCPCLQVCDAMRCLHSNVPLLIHRDLKVGAFSVLGMVMG